MVFYKNEVWQSNPYVIITVKKDDSGKTVTLMAMNKELVDQVGRRHEIRENHRIDTERSDALEAL